jgi:type II secretory pathway pseudopilin PulG
MSTRTTSAGFTLAELTVVLIIVGLLLGGMLIPLGAQTDLRYRSDTTKALTDIREALIGYAIVNGRLPCPADRTIATATANAGTEAVTVAGGPCACTAAASGIAATGGVACNDTTPDSVTGVLPWATLGLPETDAWGNRYTYRVTTRFGRAATGQTTFGTCAPASNPAAAAFALCSTGDIAVFTDSTRTVGIANGIPAIVVSHGKSTAGAWTTSGTQVAVGANGDEIENTNDNINFVSNTLIDDQLIWVSPNLLMNRMIAAGKLP